MKRGNKSKLILVIALIVLILVVLIAWKFAFTGKVVEDGGETAIKKTILGSGPMTSQNLDENAKSFISEKNLGIDTSALEIIKEHESRIKTLDKNEKDFKQIQYKQKYQGLDVYKSYVGLTSIDGKNVHFKVNYFTGISVLVEPSISEQEAFEKIKNYSHNASLNLSNLNNFNNASLIIYSKEKEKDLVYYLAYRMDLPLTQDSLHSWTFFVDAHSGQIIEYYDNLVSDISGEASGMIFPVYPEQNQIAKNFSGEYVDMNNEVSTDDGGYYNIPIEEGIARVKLKLEGPYVRIYNTRRGFVFSNNVTLYSPAIYSWNWINYDTSYFQEESNAFYHTNIAHDYAIENGVNEMNFQMSVNVNGPELETGITSCNAFYNSISSSLYFLKPGCHPIELNGETITACCNSTALYSDAIYHEYGHGIFHHLNGVWYYEADFTGAISEGFADYTACTISNNSCFGEWVYSYKECLRYCNTTNRYPEDYNAGESIHFSSQIISGVWWDVREVLGKEYTDMLVIEAGRLQPLTFSEYLDDMLIVDDDNGNLSDRTPNINILCDSFANHGIFSYLCGNLPTVNLTGTIQLRQGNNSDELNVGMRNIETGEIKNMIVNSDYNGSFTIYNITAGNYSVWLKPKYYLAVKKNVEINGNVNVDFGRAGYGDFRQGSTGSSYNVVDYYDVAVFSAAYNQNCSHPYYHWYIDGNNDCRVNYVDYGSFSYYYGSEGAEI